MLRQLCFVGTLATALCAQSPLTTLYAGGNGLGAGSSIYFNVVLNAPLTFTQIDVNSSSTVGTAGTINVRWCATSYVGNDTNAAAWTLGGSGPAIAAGGGVATSVTLTPFTLPAGNYGFNVEFVGLGQNYTNGNGTTTPGSGTNQTWSTNEMTLLAGGSATAAPGTAICCNPRVFNGSLHYIVSGSGTIATRTSYGAGCYKRISSFYENFATSAAFDLANSSASMIPSGGGYVVLPGISPFVAPTAAATALALTDDSETTVTLASPFPHSTGTTPSLTVCSNGYVSIATGNGTGFTPTVATMLAAPQTGWWNWHDYNPAAAGSGQVKFETVGSLAIITWDGVYDFGGTTAANANTFQFQFDTATGAVHFVFGAISTLGNGRLVGYSPGGASNDPGNLDISAALPGSFTVTNVDINALRLAASARPLIGTTITLDTSEVTGTSVGINFLSTTQIPAPGLDLAIIGAPGCPALVDINAGIGQAINNFVPGGLSAPFSIPNNAGLLGLGIYSQSAWLDASANAFGVLTSNGIQLVLGNL